MSHPSKNIIAWSQNEQYKSWPRTEYETSKVEINVMEAWPQISHNICLEFWDFNVLLVVKKGEKKSSLLPWEILFQVHVVIFFWDIRFLNLESYQKKMDLLF